MTDPKTSAPHPAAANDHPTVMTIKVGEGGAGGAAGSGGNTKTKVAHAPPPKAAPKAAPRPAPRAPIPSVTIKPEPEQSKGKIAAMVGVTLAAGALIGRGVFGVASKMLGRGR